MNRVVFIIHTEYHLIASLGIIDNYFPSRENDVIIYQFSPIDGKRLTSIDKTFIPVEYRLFEYDYQKPTIKVRNKIDEIINLKPTHFIYFLEDKFWSNYLLKRLHKQGTKVIVGPDGANVYENYHYGIKHRVENFLWFTKMCIQSRMFPPFPVAEKYLATNRYIDEIWAEYPENHNNEAGKIMFRFSLPQSVEYTNLLNKVFKFREDDGLLSSKSIIFFDSGFSSLEYYKKIKEVLCFLKDSYPDRKIYVKCHQLTAHKAMKEYEQIPNVQFLNTAFPAELYVLNTVDSLLVSVYSSSMFVTNLNCKYYFIYPLLPEVVKAPHFNTPGMIRTCYRMEDLSVIK